ncbi:MAG: hypothetical protein FWC79_07445 [Oscillospiraceae bacterium]|nr:hypothetical protein [Oscillospiraceae bacterium]
MIKRIVKELIIFVLLVITMALLLGLLFYDYIPYNREVPLRVEEFVLPENIEEELISSEGEQRERARTFSTIVLEE